MKKKSSSLIVILLVVCLFSCQAQRKKKIQAIDVENNAKQAFNDYWYQGKAEISSYELKQARYGEIRDGEAVLIFVTEDFLVDSQVKKEQETEEKSTSVLKLNFIRKFPTGIYDYSMMTSTFNQVHQEELILPIKSTTSSQEWCGHSWMQLNREEKGFHLISNSYFQKEGDQKINVDQVILEDGLWAQIRLNPDLIPRGERQVFPSSQYLRFSHREIKPYKAIITVSKVPKSKIPNLKSLMINYPELDRLLKIYFHGDFPHEITGWEESRKSGFGDEAQLMKTIATKKARIMSPYWGKNSNKDEILRDSLKLK